MALRSLLSARVFTTSVQRTILRRGFAAAVDRVGSNKTHKAEIVEETAVIKEESNPPSWVPDPVTGYYKPYDPAPETDPAELREKILKQKITEK